MYSKIFKKNLLRNPKGFELKYLLTHKYGPAPALGCHVFSLYVGKLLKKIFEITKARTKMFGMKQFLLHLFQGFSNYGLFVESRPLKRSWVFHTGTWLKES
jgi:hypothetical protein